MRRPTRNVWMALAVLAGAVVYLATAYVDHRGIPKCQYCGSLIWEKRQTTASDTWSGSVECSKCGAVFNDRIFTK